MFSHWFLPAQPSPPRTLADAGDMTLGQLIARGRYEPPSLGVRTDPRVDALAARSGIEGVVILGVEPGSAAARAGLEPARVASDGTLRARDVIVAVDGRRVETTQDLVAVLDTHGAGDEVTLALTRGGDRREVTVTLDPGGR